MPRRIYPNLSAFLKDNPDVTASDLAREVGCSPAFISMIKWGERQPALPLALELARRCNVPLESLVRKRLAKAS